MGKKYISYSSMLFCGFDNSIRIHLSYLRYVRGLIEEITNKMKNYEAKRLPIKPDAVAPDGSDVRLLLGLGGGGMAHFELSPDETSTAVTHKTVEEIWFFISGRGEMWRMTKGNAEIVPVDSGVCVTIPLGTHFQFRSFGEEPLAAIGVTMPPWPGDGEAIIVEGVWTATVP
jgi:mannose-6-phosphate isomerase-like protein (cupin superfamily)